MGAFRIGDGLTRRDLIKLGALGVAGFGWPAASRPAQAARPSARAGGAGTARAAILVWCAGGPSHLDSFDPKPDAPAEVRGAFRAISARGAEFQLCEHLPRLAAMGRRFSLIRSVTHQEGAHDRAAAYVLTGFPPTPGVAAPAFGARLAARTGPAAGIPPWVAIPEPILEAGGGFLGPEAAPLAAGDPGGEGCRPPADGLPPGVRSALKLDREPAALRERYGRHPLGQGCLLARRLVEAGVAFVSIRAGGWDTHGGLFEVLREERLPELDVALSALLQDLEDRGLLASTLVVATGEFGRTPRINSSGGRDHWPHAQSVLVAGGGVPGGLALGRTDARGEEPVERPVRPEDLAATLRHRLGLMSPLEDPAAGVLAAGALRGEVLRELA